MQFYFEGSLITLKGLGSPLLAPASFNQLLRMIHTDAIVTCHTISMLHTNTNHSFKTEDLDRLQAVPPKLQHIITQ